MPPLLLIFGNCEEETCGLVSTSLQKLPLHDGLISFHPFSLFFSQRDASFLVLLLLFFVFFCLTKDRRIRLLMNSQ